MATEHGETGTEEATVPDDGRGRSTRLDDATVVKLGGVAELLAVALVLVSIGIAVSAGMRPETPAPGEMGGWLGSTAAVHGTYVTTTWLFVADHLLEIAFVVALYRLTREAGLLARVALVAGVLGLFTVSVSGFVQLGLAALAAQYVGAGAAARPGIVATAVALEQVRVGLNFVGTTVAWGVGGAAFSAIVLRTGVLSRWLGWLGLAFAGVVWLNLLRLVSSTFEPLIVLMLLVGLVWLPAMGLALVRFDPADLPA